MQVSTAAVFFFLQNTPFTVIASDQSSNCLNKGADLDTARHSWCRAIDESANLTADIGFVIVIERNFNMQVE